MDLKVVLYVLFVANSLLVLSGKAVPNKKKGFNCKEQRKFQANPFVEKGSQKSLQKMLITCTGPQIVFEVRYSNGSLCACGKIQEEMQKRVVRCQQNLSSLDIIVKLSTNKIEKYKVVCDISLTFFPTTEGDFSPRQVTILKQQLRDPLPNASLSMINDNGVSYAVSQVRTTSIPSSKSRSDQYPMVTPIFYPKSRSNFTMQSSSVVESSKVVTVETSRTTTSTSVAQTKNPVATPVLRSTIHSILSTSVHPTPFYEPTHSVQDNVIRTSSNFLQTSLLSESKTLKKATTVIQPSPTTLEMSPTSSVSPIDKTRKKFMEDVQFITNFNTSVVDMDDKETIERVLDAATNLITTNQTLDDRKEDPGMQAVKVLENLGNTISQQLDLGNESSVTFQEVSEELVFGVAVINTTTSKKFFFPSKEAKMTGDEKIVIPNSVFSSNNPGTAYFVGIIFKPYREMKNKTGGLKLGTKVINAVVSPPPSDVLDEPVEMTFEKNIGGKSFGSECSFWMEDSSYSGEYGRWSTRGCVRTFENQSHIKCACYHFTNFAVLFKITDDQDVSEEEAYHLAIITYVGLSLSIFGCLLTFVIFATLQNIKSERAVIHMNLVLALGLADVIFLVTIAAKPVQNSCLAAAMLAFYFYLCVFFWMLVEGVYIYLMVIKVFRGNVSRRRRMGYLVGWGCPLLIAIITWAVLRNDVISKYHCWLSVETGAIWAFVGPGLTIILINCVILLTVIKTTWATFSDKTEYGGLKSASKTFGAVIPILGITWVFGVMAFNESSVVFQYIFAITNSIQGALIFVLYCVINKEVRNELLHRFSIWRTRRDVTSSTGVRRHILASTQSAKEVQDSSLDPPQELKKKQSSSLLDDAFPFQDSETTNAKGRMRGDGIPEKNHTIVENSWDSIGYV